MQAQEEFVMIKGKRSKRPRLASPLALTIATSSDLSGGGDVGDGVISDVSPCNSGAAAHHTNEEEEDMANCLILLAKGQRPSPPPEAYQCKTCSRSFPSFQALGGHRASHKTKPNKPATSSTSNLEETKRAWMRESFVDVDGTNLSLQMRSAAPNKSSTSRVHECSICGAEFGSGQALGGHMRRHRPIPAAASGEGQAQAQGVKRARNQLLSLDLNLPAPEDDHHLESKFPFAQKEQVIVFAASPLIDCHY